jgi:hypothetical protein
MRSLYRNRTGRSPSPPSIPYKKINGFLGTGVVGNLFDIVPALTDEVKKAKAAV